jgi:hypothetical protein
LQVKRLALIGSLAALVIVVAAASASPGPALEAQGPHGIVPPRGAGHAKPGSSPNLTYHGGPIMTSAAVTAIFWGTNWVNSSFVGDKIGGLDSFYSTITESGYIKTNTEYTQSGGAHVGSTVSYGGHVIDKDSSLTRAPNTTTDILAEVAKEISNPVANGYYPVYTDLPRGHARYCAWHSAGTINGTPVQFAFFFSLDGDPGCAPDGTAGHSPGLAALANVSGHELSEALTDPRLDAWYDSQGEENADKCAWTFNGAESFGGSTWYIQGNWSNNAYNTRSGYDGAGCINGN